MSKSKFDPTRLGRMRETLASHVTGTERAGMVALISSDRETHVQALGVKRDAIFRISSMTKPITAVAALILVEDCKLRLDDPVDPLLPELAELRVLRHPLAQPDDTVPLARPITLRDLLTFRMGTGFTMELQEKAPLLQNIHESGLAGFGAPDPSYPVAPDEWLKQLAQFPLFAQPGERWLYNTAYYVLGVLIRRVTGQSLQSYFQERIFDPLGMKDTGFHVPKAKLSRLSRCYWFDSAAQKLELHDGPADSAWSKPPRFEDAAAGLVSTADDFLAFSRMLLCHGKAGRTRILSPASVEAMTADQLTAQQKSHGGLFAGDWDYRGYGFGVMVVNQRDSMSSPPGQFGWDGGFGSSWRIDPRSGLIGIIMTERTFDSPQPPAAIQDFWTLAYGALRA